MKEHIMKNIASFVSGVTLVGMGMVGVYFKVPNSDVIILCGLVLVTLPALS